MTTPTFAQWQRGLQIAEQIDALEKELASIIGNHSSPVAKATPAQADRRKGRRSSATIAKMKASQKARWATVKGKKPAVVSKAAATTPLKKKSTMSAEAKAKLSAMMKARWESRKAGVTPAVAEAPAPAETATE